MKMSYKLNFAIISNILFNTKYDLINKLSTPSRNTGSIRKKQHFIFNKQKNFQFVKIKKKSNC
ncbi:hypothetical protein PGB90_002696 [Kerria lacca]